MMQLKLDGSEIPTSEVYPPKPKGAKRYLRPIELWGPCPEPGHTCGECDHCCSKRWSRVYYKCEEWKDSNGPATDIRLKWPACAKFKPEE
jgi:hypothetical protein